MYLLKDIKGNERLKNVFINSKKNNSVLNSYIIEGENGIGKMFIAKCFAKYLECTQSTNDSCGECRSCVSFDSGNNPDVIYIDKDPKKNDLTVDIIRDRIISDVYIKPFSNKYKIYIVKNADKMNAAAQNAFLKTLEQPPEYAVFILLAENSASFLPTVLSRCTVFSAERLKTSVISEYLTENGISEKDKSDAFAACSGGVLGRAVKTAENAEYSVMRDNVYSMFLKLSGDAKSSPADSPVERIYACVSYLEENKENIYPILEIAALFYRDALVYKCMGSHIFTVNKDKAQETHTLAANTSIEKLTESILSIARAEKDLRQKINFTQAMEVMLFGIKEKK